MPNPLERVFGKHKSMGTVVHTGLVTPTMKRIVIASDALRAMTFTPGQHFRIEINDPLSLYGIVRPGETLRTYSIWDHSEGTFEIRAHLYEGDGIGLRWVREATAGDPVTFWGPLGDFTIREDAPYHLFAGEETAAAAFGPILGLLSPDARVYGVLESESAEDEVPVPGPHELRRVHRRGAPAVSSQTLLTAVAGLDLPAEPGAAYLAGEARTCQAIRDHLVRDRGWERRQIRVKPFWTPGKRGLHH
ncbi:siderophore-interacting protein [Actinomadura rudentiformis]|uniref:Siderophore-interacting protein n=1 Tax=Actinomadura rudentiformis TaxID=359158 RepID=A0A6H9Z3P0_9ACTN|nr:siderophore-interacting protein [Actinomadura rudentiformis]KAB2349431.1 siderophore-interacting protein [Actinomadura rudentiformis]